MGRTSVVRARSSRARPGVTGSPGPANSALDCRLAGRVGTAIRSGMAALLSGCDAGRSNRMGPACADRFPIVSGRASVSPAATSPRISRSRLLRSGSWSATSRPSWRASVESPGKPCTGVPAVGPGLLDLAVPARTTRSSSKWPGRTRPTGLGWWLRWPVGSSAGRSTAMGAAGDAHASVAAAVTIGRAPAPARVLPRRPPGRVVAPGHDQGLDAA